MAVPTEPAGRSGGKVVALVLAVFFLAVIGASAGYILGLRHRHATRAAAQETTQPAQTGGRNSVGPVSKRCLDETERDAKQKFGSPGGLVQMFYVQTDKSEAWICKDSANTLFYQGHRRSNEERQSGQRAPLVDLTNSLLLKTVRPDGNGGWIAENVSANGTTRYLVSAAGLTLEQPNSKPDRQPALKHEP
jgi:hypothetical protein